MDRQFSAIPQTPDPAIAALLEGPAAPAVLLHAGRGHARWARRSILARPTCWYRFDLESGGQLIDATGRMLERLCPPGAEPWADLRRLLERTGDAGCWAGYFSYDLGRLIEPDRLPPSRPTCPPWPLIELGLCEKPAYFEPVDSGSASLHASADPWFVSNFTRAEYLQAVTRALEYIAAGDIFQVNLSQQLSSRFEGDPRELFARLAAKSPAWYGAMIRPPASPGRALCSTSPELLLEVDGEQVVTRPIKGTLAAERDPGELLASEKDKAELAMIVDLMRNDLGRVCRFGSVRVVEERTIETHPTVHQGVATVAGRLAEGRDLVDLLQAVLPGGSVTGAPKVRAMQIIDELEPDARGPWCGAIGWIGPRGGCLSVAIRTMLLDEQADRSWGVRMPVGGGIVADSDPMAEYRETMAKARVMLAALSSS